MTTIHASCPWLFAGLTSRVELEIVADKETRVSYIDARVTGHQGWTIGSGKYVVSYRLREPYVVKRLMGEGVLQPGTTRLAFDVYVPPGTPPTHETGPASAYVELRVHVAIPWRFDDRATFRLPVRLAPGPPVPPIPSVWSSPSTRGDEPRIELGLASTRVAAGDTLVGSCAVFHMDDRKPRDVTITLAPVFLLYGRGRMRVHRADGFGTTLELPAGSAGSSMPFALALPAAATPSFAAQAIALTWEIEARTGSLFSAKVVVAGAIQIVDAIGADPTSSHAVPPGLTDDLVARVFAGFAHATGWHAVDVGDPVGIAIARAEGDAELQLSYAHRAGAGTFLIARVAYPSLGLGLEVTPSSVLRHVFFKDIEVGVGAWDRANRVHARDEAQALPVLQAIVPALVAAEPIGALARWTDHAVEFERLVLGVGARDLALASDAMARVAAAIASARALDTPPVGCAIDVDAWRELARSLDGHLALADLSIAGARGAAPVHLGLDFDERDQPIAVHATVGDPEQAGELARAVTLSLAHPASDAAQAAEATAVTELVTRWPADLVDLHLANGVAAASYRLPAPVADGASRAVDASRVRELVENLHAVIAALAPASGPYR